ncbi:alpha/beta hydrolase [Bdellovibrio bacteriovorus]|nr:alpha/beta hydrolase [Bdellovibrio bacteriovorus]
MKSYCHWSLSTLGIVMTLTLSGCGHLFYYPTQYMYVDLKKVDPKPEQVEFKNQDGKKLIGWYFKGADKPKAKILFFHGNAENISSHFLMLHWILKHGYDYFIFDYPGYGGSEGEPTQKSTTEAGQMALEWLSKKSPQVPLVVFGQSLGGNIALYTAAQNQGKIPLCLVAVESTFKSYKKVGQRLLAGRWWTWPLQWVPLVTVGESYSATDRIDKISPTPLLVMHGDADRVVPLSNGEDVFNAAKEPKEFWRVPNGLHIRAFFGSDGADFQKRFLDKLATSCR